MPIVTVNTSDVLSASHFNAQYRDQVVSTIANSGARPAGTEGQLVYELDTNRLYIYTGSGWEMVYQQGAWTSYTPQIDQGATINIAKTTDYAKYAQFGKTVIANGAVTLTAAGTATAQILVSLPVTAASAAGTHVIGSGFLYDASGTTGYAGAAAMASTTRFGIHHDTAQNNFLGLVGFTGALASADLIRWGIQYEAA